jgi:hypothetical protein
VNDINSTSDGVVRVLEYDAYSSSWVQLGGVIGVEAADDEIGKAVSLSANGTLVAVGAPFNDGIGEDAGHVRVFKYNSSSWVQLGADIDGEAAGDESGEAISLSADGSRVAIGAPGNDDGGSDAGHVRVYSLLLDNSWSQLGGDIDGGEVDAQCGQSISLSPSGARVALGCQGVSNTGLIRVYEFDSGSWAQLGSDIGGEVAGDRSGASVSLSHDGSRVAIGAPQHVNNTGHVRVFEYDSSSWVQLGADIDGEAEDDLSGAAVSLSADGSRLAIGAPGNNDGGASVGHVRVFDYHSLASVWIQLGTDIDGDAVTHGSGGVVSVSPDGSRGAIGAYDVVGSTGQARVWQLDYVPTGEPSGQPSGQPTFGLRDWQQLGADIDGEAAGDKSGWAISLSPDGARLAIGAHENDGGGTYSGHVRVYEYDSSSWVQIGADIDGEDSNDYSQQVSLSFDGSRVAIGAVGNDDGGTDAGHVRVYEYSSSSWVLLGADIDGEAAGDESGKSVSLSYDGARVAIGSILNGGGGTDAGHVRVYEYDSSSWVQLGADIEGEAAGDNSGRSVSLSSDGARVAIGSILNGGGGTDAGHVRVFEYNSSSWVQLGAGIEGEAANDQSGFSVSLALNGTRVAIGAFINNESFTGAGHVRVYQYDSFSWVQLGADIDGEAEDDLSGIAVSLSADGTRLAIGAQGNDAGGSNAGHVRIFDYDILSSAWIQMGADIDGDVAGGLSGRTVSLSADGSRVAIGAYAVNSDAGQVRVWQLAYVPTGQPTGQPTVVVCQNKTDAGGACCSN